MYSIGNLICSDILLQNSILQKHNEVFEYEIGKLIKYKTEKYYLNKEMCKFREYIKINQSSFKPYRNNSKCIKRIWEKLYNKSNSFLTIMKTWTPNLWLLLRLEHYH